MTIFDNNNNDTKSNNNIAKTYDNTYNDNLRK